MLYASLVGIGLLARSLHLWDTQTVQLLVRDVRESHSLKYMLYVVLGAQLVLYGVASLLRVDYAFVVCALGLNYLATRAPQMLWAYALLTLATLPQDAAEVARMYAQWGGSDVVDRTCRLAIGVIVGLKGAAIGGMLLMHTRVRFKLQFFEFERIVDERAPLDGSPGGYGGKPSGAASASPDRRLSAHERTPHGTPPTGAADRGVIEL